MWLKKQQQKHGATETIRLSAAACQRVFFKGNERWFEMYVHVTTSVADPRHRYVRTGGATGCRRHTVAKCWRSSAVETGARPNCPGWSRQARNPSTIRSPVSSTAGRERERGGLGGVAV